MSPATIISPSPDNIGALFVTYHPEPGFVDYVQKITKQAKAVVIVDNASSPSCLGLLRPLPNLYPNVYLLENPDNLGLGTALNQGTQFARDLGCAWVLSLDQDSLPHADMVKTLCQAYEDAARQGNVALIGSNYLFDTGVPARPTRWRGKTSKPCHMVITSGSLLSLAAYQIAGPYRDDFFIDSLDREYCLRLLRCGFAVVMTTKPTMTHNCGTPTQHSYLLGKLATTHHSPLRRYYITRNWLVVLGDYFSSFPRYCLHEAILFVLDAATALLLEPGRPTKLRSIFSGVRDACLGRLGKKDAHGLNR